MPIIVVSPPYYIQTSLTTLDPGQSYQAQKKSVQSVDNYGNVTQVQNYDFGNLTTPARTYNYTYLNSSAYVNGYIPRGTPKTGHAGTPENRPTR